MLSPNVDKEKLEKASEIDKSVEKLKAIQLNRDKESEFLRGENKDNSAINRKKSQTNPDHDATVLSTLSPGRIFRCEVENFIRQAKWKIDANIYICECWTQKSKIADPVDERIQ